MATTTTNFGWDIPQSTDLVKDGATAIAALGQDIDTSLYELKGGTTGQVLSKTSNTDMDFTWVAQDDSNAIQNAIVDAKGDLIGATAADTPARLAVGTNGQVLTADSAEATGLKWAAPAGGGKVLQVVQATTTTRVNIASTTFTDSTLTATITPSSATSKILVLTSQQAYSFSATSDTAVRIRLLRGSTVIWGNSATGATLALYVQSAGQTEFGTYMCINYLDSPATTSAITYKTQGRAETAASSGELSFHKFTNDNTITLMEIGA